MKITNQDQPGFIKSHRSLITMDFPSSALKKQHLDIPGSTRMFTSVIRHKYANRFPKSFIMISSIHPGIKLIYYY